MNHSTGIRFRMSLSKLITLVQKHPVIPSMATFGLLFPGANIVQQIFFKKYKAEHEQRVMDWSEVRRFSLYGGLFHGPLVHNWVRTISRLFPKTTVSHVIVKVLLDQFCLGPVVISTFIIVLTAMEGKTSQEIYQQWKMKLLSTWATGACMWPVLNTINHKMVHLKFRTTTYLGICNFFWFIILAHFKSVPSRPEITSSADFTIETTIDNKL